MAAWVSNSCQEQDTCGQENIIIDSVATSIIPLKSEASCSSVEQNTVNNNGSDKQQCLKILLSHMERQSVPNY